MKYGKTMLYIFKLVNLKMCMESSQEFKAFNNRTNLTIVKLPDGLINIFFLFNKCVLD
jgi:hypothetical protein